MVGMMEQNHSEYGGKVMYMQKMVQQILDKKQSLAVANGICNNFNFSYKLLGMFHVVRIEIA